MGAPKLSRCSLVRLACRDMGKAWDGNWEGWDNIQSLSVELTGASLERRDGPRVRGGMRGFVFGTLGNSWDLDKAGKLIMWCLELGYVHWNVVYIVHANWGICHALMWNPFTVYGNRIEHEISYGA